MKSINITNTAKMAVLAAAISATQISYAKTPEAAPFLKGYAEIAIKGYTDSLIDAKTLQKAIHAFTKKPTAVTLQAAKDAWLLSRESYGLTEAFRLSEGPIDAEEGWVADAYGALESQINAWPLDENMIDYTTGPDGKITGNNIISTKGNYTPAATEEASTPVNVDVISKQVLTDLNENGGEANVTSGYHAIEFLLWGQDQDYGNFQEDKVTHGPMIAGQRPLSDFTTDKYAARRLQYLNAAVDKLVDDLTTVQSAWTPKTGVYAKALQGQLAGKEAGKNIAPQTALKNIFAGLGVFIKSELANERIAVAVLTPSEEDEHSCFSDNTHRDLYTNYAGFKNVLTGTYKGKKIGVSLVDQLPAADKAKVTKLMADIEKRIDTVNTLATTTMHFDYQIMSKNEKEAKNLVVLKNDLRKLGNEMVNVAKAYGVSLTTDDVTDAEETKLD